MDRALVGDVGGTHARLALVDLDLADAPLEAVRTLACADHPSLDAVLVAYLAGIGEQAGRPYAAALAVAGPQVDGEVRFTNLPWTVSAERLRRDGFEHALVLNDFEALALGAPRLKAADLAFLGEPLVGPGGAVAVLGPGTGFGAAALTADGGVVVSEGGHAGWAPSDERDAQVWAVLHRRFGRVSIERVLSGPGLVNLHHALCELRGEAPRTNRAEEVTAAARRGEGAAAEAVERFCRSLGAVAGDFALAFGARGGVYIAGGVAVGLRPELAAGGFRAAFEDKGRLQPFVAPVVTALCLEPRLALLGAAEALRRVLRA